MTLNVRTNETVSIDSERYASPYTSRGKTEVKGKLTVVRKHQGGFLSRRSNNVVQL